MTDMKAIRICRGASLSSGIAHGYTKINGEVHIIEMFMKNRSSLGFEYDGDEQIYGYGFGYGKCAFKSRTLYEILGGLLIKPVEVIAEEVHG